jgi:pyruvate,water dikinase
MTTGGRDPIPGTGADTLHGSSRPHDSWTTTNVGEAVPGVQTPLGWSVWGPAGESGLRRAFHTIGALDRTETAVPADPEDRIFTLFYGRIAMHLDLLCKWADRVPGTSGEAMATQLFSYVPPAYSSRPRYRYYPRVIARAGLPWILGPRQIRSSRATMERFWWDSVHAAPTLDADGARRLLLHAAAEFATVIYHHTVLTLGAVQPVYDLLVKLTHGGPISAQELMGGHGGHEETAMLQALWECSRGRLSEDHFIDRYGYHGPNEGDISTAAWREDPAPVRRLLASYRDRPDDADPASLQHAQMARRHAVERRFLSAMPVVKRGLARGALALGRRYIPLRGVGKVAFLQGIDTCRAAARRLGALHAVDGTLGSPDDVFFLTLEDLRTGWPRHAAELAAERRVFYEHYLKVDLPEIWQGEPHPVTLDGDQQSPTIHGIGASPGIVEGLVRLVLDPAEADIQAGEILVARNTDPAWASLMFLSAGLVSDVGGLMSHTAVVARELGIPCAVNTRTATRTLRTGDRIRLDGTNGTVERIPPTHL